MKVQRCAANQQLPAVRSILAGGNLDQGGFTGAVLPDQAVNLTRKKLRLNTIQGYHPRKGLGCILQLYKRRHGPEMEIKRRDP
jgi:hypothetical protein